MDNGDFTTYVLQERERLLKKREGAATREQKIQEELAEIDTELAALDAYESVRSGKPVKTSATPKRGRRKAVLEAITSSPTGLGRSGVLEALAIKGNKAEEQAVSNALTALKKNGSVRADANGTYFASDQGAGA